MHGGGDETSFGSSLRLLLDPFDVLRILLTPLVLLSGKMTSMGDEHLSFPD